MEILSMIGTVIWGIVLFIIGTIVLCTIFWLLDKLDNWTSGGDDRSYKKYVYFASFIKK